MKKKAIPEDVLDYFRKQGAKGGKIGGKRSLETMTPEERAARASLAGQASAAARAAKKKATKKGA
jgi:hypothetical protein